MKYDEKTKAAVDRLANTVQGLEIRCENVPTVWDDYQTILAALDAANERAERFDKALEAAKAFMDLKNDKA